MKKGLYALYLVLFFAVFFSTLRLAGVPVMFYLDIASLLLILLFLLLITICPWGFRKTLGFYRAVFDRDASPEHRKEGAAYFRSITTFTMLAGLLGFITGMIAMLGNLNDTSKMGPYLAVAMITVLYAAILCMTVFLPFRMSLEKED